MDKAEQSRQEQNLNEAQAAQTERQIDAYERGVGVGLVKVPLAEDTLELQVDKYVANPEIMNSGTQMIKYLSEHPELVKGKIVTDMGTGCGIIGVSSALLGAETVFMPDIEQRAVDNAQSNISRLKLGKKCETFQSDLFSNYGERPKSQVQIFNHPFFAAPPIEGKPWTKMMFGGTELIGKYFQEAPKYSTSDAIYLLPWLTLADNADGRIDNDPGKRAEEYGFEVVEVVEQAPVNRGLQQALFKIYKLKKIN